MIVTPQRSKNRDDQIIALCDRKLCVFADGSMPKLGKSVEVIVTGASYKVIGEGWLNQRVISVAFVRLIEPDDLLIQHQGFVRKFNSTRVQAEFEHNDRLMWLTPGRTPVHCTLEGTAAPKAGGAWIKRELLQTHKQVLTCRIEGVTTLQELA